MLTVTLHINNSIRAYFASIKEAMLLMESLGEEFYGQDVILTDSKSGDVYGYEYSYEGWVKR